MTTRHRPPRAQPQKHLRQVAEDLEAFVDTLIPGDALFPSASQAGVHQVLAERLRVYRTDSIDQLISTLDNNGSSFKACSPQQRVRVVRRLERSEPEFFAFILSAVYLAYYQHPLVVRAIRWLGHEYNDAPQPAGYSMPVFDPQVDAPKHGRGFYKKTHEIKRLDTSKLETLLGDLPRYPNSADGQP